MATLREFKENAPKSPEEIREMFNALPVEDWPDINDLDQAIAFLRKLAARMEIELTRRAGEQ